MNDLVIRNGILVTSETTQKADIAIDKGKIVKLGFSGNVGRGKKEINAKGKLVMPGLIDPHIHIAHPFQGDISMDDFYTATKAAVYGGNTSIIDFAIQWDKNLNMDQCIQKRKSEAEGNAVIDYSFHACPTKSNEETIQEVLSVYKHGITSFKTYMIYRKQGRMVDDAILFGLLQKNLEFGGILGVHAENAAIAEYNEVSYVRQGLVSAKYFPEIKPNIVEAEGINRAVFFNKWLNSRLYIFHLSTYEGLQIIRNAQREGYNVICETCTHYLTLNKDIYSRKDGYNYICSPPLRSQTDIDSLWAGIKDGTISVVSTDHCGFGKKQKASGKGKFTDTPHGLPGIEVRLPLMYTEGVMKKGISINRMVEVLSTNPAKIFNMYPKKGSLTIGSDADLVIIDTNKEMTLTNDKLHSPVDWTPYEGMKLSGFAYATILRGEILMQDGEFYGKKGYGQFITRMTDKN